MTNAIVKADVAPMDVMTMGKMLAQSGYFQDAKDAAQAVVKVLAGQEMGIGPVAAMTGIYIVKGRVTLSANLMAAQIKRSGKYNYRVARNDETGCEIVFFEDGDEIGRSSFTADDAKVAGLWNSSDPWKKTPRNMLFARAMSNGAKWYCPDIFSGPVYTPDELEESAPEPATDKQRNYIAVLMDKLAWTTEQLSAYAYEQRIDLVMMTRDEASGFIDGLKTLADQRSADRVTGEMVSVSSPRDELLGKIEALWNEAADLGTPVDEAHKAMWRGKGLYDLQKYLPKAELRVQGLRTAAQQVEEADLNEVPADL